MNTCVKVRRISKEFLEEQVEKSSHLCTFMYQRKYANMFYVNMKVTFETV